MSGQTKMTHGTGIEWTHIPGYKGETWNPVTGCTKVSDGCARCYAETYAHRFWGERPFTDVQCHDDRLAIPLRWQKPRAIFVNSMSDLFHEKVPFEFIDKVLAVAALCPQHIFIVLTKRPERMAEYFANSAMLDRKFLIQREMSGSGIYKLRNWRSFPENIKDWPLPNLWPGVSVENQKTADERIPKLLQCPAAIRFVSAEPALGPICFLKMWLNPGPCGTRCGLGSVVFPFKKMPQIDWIIVGGESGPGARPSHPDWFRKVRDDCHAAGVPFFFKQWGKWAPHPYPPTKGKNTGAGIFMRADGTWGNQGEFWDGEAQAMDKHKNKKAAGNFLDGKQYHQFPEVG